MTFLVLKFGGTSLVSLELRKKEAGKIIVVKEEGYAPVVVVYSHRPTGRSIYHGYLD